MIKSHEVQAVEDAVRILQRMDLSESLELQTLLKTNEEALQEYQDALDADAQAEYDAMVAFEERFLETMY